MDRHQDLLRRGRLTCADDRRRVRRCRDGPAITRHEPIVLEDPEDRRDVGGQALRDELGPDWLPRFVDGHEPEVRIHDVRLEASDLDLDVFHRGLRPALDDAAHRPDGGVLDRCDDCRVHPRVVLGQFLEQRRQEGQSLALDGVVEDLLDERVRFDADPRELGRSEDHLAQCRAVEGADLHRVARCQRPDLRIEHPRVERRAAQDDDDRQPVAVDRLEPLDELDCPSPVRGEDEIFGLVDDEDDPAVVGVRRQSLDREREGRRVLDQVLGVALGIGPLELEGDRPQGIVAGVDDRQDRVPGPPLEFWYDARPDQRRLAAPRGADDEDGCWLRSLEAVDDQLDVVVAPEQDGRVLLGQSLQARVRGDVGVPARAVARPEPDPSQIRHELVDEFLDVADRSDRLGRCQDGVDWFLPRTDLDDVLASGHRDRQLRVAPARFERRRRREEDDDPETLQVEEQLLRPLGSGRDPLVAVLVTEDVVSAFLEQLLDAGRELDVLRRVAQEDRTH